MEIPEFCKQLEELFDVASDSLQPNCVIEEIPGWSSLTFLGLIALVDDLYNVTIKPRDVLQCQTIEDLFGMIKCNRASQTAA